MKPLVPRSNIKVLFRVPRKMPPPVAHRLTIHSRENSPSKTSSISRGLTPIKKNQDLPEAPCFTNKLNFSRDPVITKPIVTRPAAREEIDATHQSLSPWDQVIFDSATTKHHS